MGGGWQQNIMAHTPYKFMSAEPAPVEKIETTATAAAPATEPKKKSANPRRTRKARK